MNTMETTEEVSLHPGENGHASQKKHRNTPGAREKPWANWKKGLAILWSRKRITKTPTLVVGKKPYGKCQFKNSFNSLKKVEAKRLEACFHENKKQYKFFVR